jgi:hypothetical protein
VADNLSAEEREEFDRALSPIAPVAPPDPSVAAAMRAEQVRARIAAAEALGGEVEVACA